jgi:DHA1 family multidrug resistance protein-like MFS transporter
MAGWRRILYVMVVAQIMAQVGFSFVFPFLPLYLEFLGQRGPAVALWAGIISFSQSLAMALISPVWGSLADRHGRKPMVVRALAGGAVPIGLLMLAPTVWVVLVLRIVQGLLAGSVSASQALMASLTPREQMGFSMGLMQSAIFLGAALGPLVGGVVNDRVGFDGTFAGGAALLAVAAVLVVLLVDEPFTRPAPPAREAGARGGSLLSRLVASPGLLAMALVLLMSEFANVVPAPVLPLFVGQLHGVPRVAGQPQTATAVGVILAAAGVCAALASWYVQRLSSRFGYRRVLIGATALAGIFYLPAFFAQDVWQMVAVRALVGLALGSAMPCATAIVGLITPQHRRASGYSLLASATSIGVAVGPLVGGALGAFAGLRPVFLVTAFSLMLVSIVVARVVQEPRSDSLDGEAGLAPVPRVGRAAEARRPGP